MIGKTTGHYEILSKLGEGGMGEVYRARDTRLGREVALKVMPVELSEDEERRQRFEREARAVAALKHPNIVTIHSVEEFEGRPFLTMELVEGKSLTDLIPEGGLPLERFFALAIPIADALSFAHEQGITHRDLKPANIVLDAQGRPKVLDFGLAKIVARADEEEERTIAQNENITARGHILGTVAYMSPEQAEGKPLDHRTDIFSLGVVFYEMLTGQRPFRGETPMSTISSILKDDPPRVTKRNAALPRHLGRIVHRCLEKSPVKRYQTARDVCNDLEGLKKEVDSGDFELSTSLSGMGIGPAESGRRSRRSFLPWIVAGAVGIAAGLAYFVVSRPSSEEQPELRTNRLTGLAGVEYAGSWSPDGGFFTYAHCASGPLDIFVQATAGGDPIRLVESPADDWNPRWSPDNRWIAFTSNRDRRGGLYLVPPLGGSVRKLADTGTDVLSSESDFVLGANPWSPDGKEIVFARKDKGGRTTLWRIDIASGAEKQLVFPGPEESDGYGSWSFSGDRIVFSRLTKDGPRTFEVSADGKDPREIPTGGVIAMFPAFSPDGENIVFLSDHGGGIDNLWTVGIASGKARQLTTGSIEAEPPLVARDGRILYGDFNHRTDLYLQGVDGTGEKRLTFHTQSNFESRISPSGDRVAYSSDRTGNAEIWLLDLATGKERQLTDDPAEDYTPDWSPDGRKIAFVSQRTGVFRLYVVDVEGLTLRPIGDEKGVARPRWTPDGGGIGCLVRSEAGTTLMLVDPEGGTGRPLLDGVSDYDWYGDANHVLYSPVEAPNEIRARNLATGEEAVVLDVPHFEIALAPDGGAFSYCTGESHFNMNLVIQRLAKARGGSGQPRASGEPVKITHGEGQWHVHNGGWSPDAARVIYTRDTDDGDLYVLEGAF